MNKIKKFLTSSKVSMGAFVLAVVLLGFSSIGGARAALTYYSENYVSQVQMQNIGVTLLENGAAVSSRDYGSAADGSWTESSGNLLVNMVPEGEKFKLGQVYDENLAVQNTGSINEYVRVTIYKYWMDKDGNKIPKALSPELIKLNLTGNGWVEDSEARTDERTVLYYTSLLPVGATSTAFADTLQVDPAVGTKVKIETAEDGTEKMVYEFDGAQFCIEAKVDAVQEHNAQDAILSAWGKNVTISGTTMIPN